MSEAQGDSVHTREPWVLALALAPSAGASVAQSVAQSVASSVRASVTSAVTCAGASRLAGFLSDGGGLFEHAQGPWPPEPGAADAALPPALAALLTGGTVPGLRLQIAAALDHWPWEADIERAHGSLAVARFLSSKPAGWVAGPEDRLGSTSTDDPAWLHVSWPHCSAAAWQAQTQGRALVAVAGEVPAWQARAFRLALQGRWVPGTRLAVAALAAALDSGLSRPQWRLYGDALHRPLAVSGVEQRRQVTSVSIDLFKSTDLLKGWGAERYAEAHAEFHRRCKRIVEAHGGRLDNPQGDDGLMAYFGLGLAHADTASQAVRAAWMLAKDVAELGFTTRQGVATGRVAVSEAQPFGMEVYLAARLQRIAPAHGIVVAESTQRLLGPDVVCEALPPVTDLPGFEKPQAAWRVVQLQSAPTGVPRRWVQGRFVGRTVELEALRRAWARARTDGDVQYQCLVGDAGIGKSRLLHEFETRLRAAEPALNFVRVAGHAETRSSAFAALALALALPPAPAPAPAPAPGLDLPGPPLSALADLAQRGAQPQDGARASERHRESPRERAALIDALLAEFAALARRAPLCCVFDDAEWLDPSTIELVERLRLQATGVPLLLVVTLREAARGRERGLHTEPVTVLRGLLPAESLDLIDALPVAVPLSAALQQRIAERAGGVPLFLEETVRMVDRQGGDPQALVQGIPDSLEDLLAARLDALGPALPLAQLAAVLGAEFAAPLWQAVLDEPEAWIQRAHAGGAMQRLLDSGLLGPPEPGRPRYRFRHALVRDAAYESLWERDRKRLHACVARVLERRPLQALGGLEMRAHHLAAAGALPEAVALLAQAARQAAEAAADREALALAQRALALLSRLPDTSAHRQQALQLHLLQAARHVALDGYGAATVESAYLRAAALCSVTQDGALRTRIDLGLEACYAMRGDLARARALAEAAIRQAPWDANLRLALQARWAWINVVFHQGELEAALQMADECLARYHPGLHPASAVQDPAVMCLCYSAWGLFERGCADQARARVQRLLALAETLNHPFSHAVAQGFAASVALFCGDHAQGLRHAEESVRLCAAGAFQAWLAHAQIIRGRLRAALGEPLAGLADMEAGYALWVGTGARITCATYLAFQAEVCLQMGDPHEAMRRLAQAREIAQRHGERYHEAELLRLQGWALWQARSSDADAEAAQALLTQALATARAQGKLGFALRSATALAGLWQARGARDEAATLLREALAAVPEHQDTLDSRAARAALAD